MKVRITFEVSDEEREAIACQTDPMWAESFPAAKASYAEVRAWIEKTVRADLETVTSDPHYQDAANQVSEYEYEARQK